MNQILCAAHLCEAVYSMTVPDGMGVIGYEAIRHVRTRTQGMAYIMPEALWIVFAGTNERGDWLSNFKIVKKDAFGWFRAHKGFAECAESVIDRCRRLAADYPGKEVFVAGHSLGGAIAALTAIALEQSARIDAKPRAIPTTITFGQPRFASRSDIERALSGEYIRIVNGSDTVPRVPKLGYSHAGREVYLRNGDGYCINAGLSEKLIDRLTSWQHERVTDHSMPEYIRALQRVKL